jgi:hypothetical protein
MSAGGASWGDESNWSARAEWAILRALQFPLRSSSRHLDPVAGTDAPFGSLTPPVASTSPQPARA